MQLRTFALFRDKGHTVINDDGENLSFNTAIETEKKLAGPNNEELKRKTQNVFPEIASSLDPKGYVVNKLFQQNIITIQQMEEINDGPDKESRAEKLLSHLFQAAHPRAFVVFRESLEKDYYWIAVLIDDTGMSNNVQYFLFSEGI